ncbi:MAG: hypothetical protein II453_07935 [Alphaproteobacteria bacterium]|nr:hypothetical protein [Alphaproteobacteria bacterium]
MKQKQTDYTVCYTGEKKLKRDYRQFFGFLEFFEAGKSDYRKEHDNFFYVDLDTIAKETGISRRSIATYVNIFSVDGEMKMLDKHEGKKGQSNHYRLTYEHKERITHAMSDEMSAKVQAEIECKNKCKSECKSDENYTFESECKNSYNPTDYQEETTNESKCKSEKLALKNIEYRIKKLEDSIKNIKSLEMESCIINSSIDVTSEKNLKDLNCFVLSFLGCSSRAEGIELYKEFTKTHKLQDDEMEFLATYTSKVGEVKGWKQTTTNNTSSTEEETRFTTTNNTSSFKTPSELDFLFLNDTNEEGCEYTTTATTTTSTLQEEKKYTVDWSINLNTAKTYFKQTAYRYAKQWMNLSDDEREKRFVSVVEGGFPESTFAPFERYIKGIVMEKLNEFATIVNEEASKYQDAVQNGNPTPSNEDDAEYFSDVVDNYAVENEKLNEQMEQTSAYIYNLLGW